MKTLVIAQGHACYGCAIYASDRSVDEIAEDIQKAGGEDIERDEHWEGSVSATFTQESHDDVLVMTRPVEEDNLPKRPFVIFDSGNAEADVAALERIIAISDPDERFKEATDHL